MRFSSRPIFIFSRVEKKKDGKEWCETEYLIRQVNGKIEMTERHLDGSKDILSRFLCTATQASRDAGRDGKNHHQHHRERGKQKSFFLCPLFSLEEVTRAWALKYVWDTIQRNNNFCRTRSSPRCPRVESYQVVINHYVHASIVSQSNIDVLLASI